MALYTYTFNEKLFKAASITSLQQSLKDNARSISLQENWEALSKLAVGSSFYLVDEKRFGITIKVNVQEPKAGGVMVFSSGKIL